MTPQFLSMTFEYTVINIIIEMMSVIIFFSDDVNMEASVIRKLMTPDKGGMMKSSNVSHLRFNCSTENFV